MNDDNERAAELLLDLLDDLGRGKVLMIMLTAPEDSAPGNEGVGFLLGIGGETIGKPYTRDEWRRLGVEGAVNEMRRAIDAHDRRQREQEDREAGNIMPTNTVIVN